MVILENIFIDYAYRNRYMYSYISYNSRRFSRLLEEKELNKLLRGFDEDEVKFYTQIFDKIQQANDTIKFTSFEIIINEINISYSGEREHNCLSLQITKDSYDKSIFIFPDDHNEEVLDFLTKYAFNKAYKLHQVKVDKQQKELIEQNKQKIKKLIK